ncbi:tRNA (guanine-N(7)-)-methyltransferase [compost metagenome]
MAKYIELLNERGEIHFKTDSQSLFEFSLNSFAEMELIMRNISLHLHKEGPREDLVFTEYEMKFMEKGQNIYRCEVVIGAEALSKHREAKLEKSQKEELAAKELESGDSDLEEN